MLLNCGVGEDSCESLGLQGDPTSPFWRRSVLSIHWKDWCWNWSSNTLATQCEELTHWKRLWCWERLRAEGEGDDRGWDGWMASLNRWTWVWVSSRSWWWTGKPGVLQSMGSQKSWTWLNWTDTWWNKCTKTWEARKWRVRVSVYSKGLWKCSYLSVVLISPPVPDWGEAGVSDRTSSGSEPALSSVDWLLRFIMHDAQGTTYTILVLPCHATKQTLLVRFRQFRDVPKVAVWQVWNWDLNSSPSGSKASCVSEYTTEDTSLTTAGWEIHASC